MTIAVCPVRKQLNILNASKVADKVRTTTNGQVDQSPQTVTSSCGKGVNSLLST